jgi:hypothetical protein
VRALEQHVGRARADLGLRAAHHARDCDGALGVGDHEVFALERARGAVERRDLLVGARAPHVDRAAAQRRRVEGVQRLAELEQHEIRHVDDDVDRAHAGRIESGGEPGGTVRPHPRTTRPT